jgi:hypothetical protein
MGRSGSLGQGVAMVAVHYPIQYMKLEGRTEDQLRAGSGGFSVKEFNGG